MGVCTVTLAYTSRTLSKTTRAMQQHPSNTSQPLQERRGMDFESKGGELVLLCVFDVSKDVVDSIHHLPSRTDAKQVLDMEQS